jgi:hypothetical protein
MAQSLMIGKFAGKESREGGVVQEARDGGPCVDCCRSGLGVARLPVVAAIRKPFRPIPEPQETLQCLERRSLL